ncbi:Protein arginine methyltransferase NDUFAF7 [Raphanus sativus]|nr:Protein arginine methyltransferase NDUFAF7 [Raphanus sativus]
MDELVETGSYHASIVHCLLLSSQTSSPKTPPFFSKLSFSPFSPSPDPPSSASSSTVDESGPTATAVGTTISVDHSALFNPSDHSHEPTPDSELVKHLKSVIKVTLQPILI